MSNYITENDNWAPKTTLASTDSILVDEGSGVYKFAALSNLLTYGNVTISNGFWSLGAATELTIADGVVTATKSVHSIDTESDAASDDLDTISGGVENAILMIYAVNSARDVVAKDGTGNLRLNGDFTMDSELDMLTLRKYGSNWVEVCRSSNA